MLLSMVDVIFGEIDHLPNQFSRKGMFIVNHVRFYLKVGGHYMICTEANNMNSIGHAIFSCVDFQREFKLIQTVMLDLVEGAYALDIGGYRMPDE
ncbi:mediator of RNA polymerase II transcription subunit 36A-like [Trifolium medium]|uniref:Mediator of RNA polymerase II transcription subunit 36A-like n=1 Tax=Trifolium medium TaxID=97028 RepID=A0A392MH72_9FABA|nr:mediator of RNA polymerase II transcription subunit 36A-like [Trifolium medium]